MRLPETGDSALPVAQPSTSIARFQPQSFGEAELPGQSVAQLGQAIQEHADRIGQLQAEDRYTQLRNWQLDHLNGPSGMLNLKGAASVNGPSLDDAMKQFTEQQQQLENGLFGTGLDRFRQLSGATELQFKDQILRHQAHESNVWAAQVADGGINSEINQIGANYANPNLVGASLARINGLIDQHAADPSVGWSAGQTDAYRRETLSKAYMARWTAWAQDDPSAALADFNANKGLITDPTVRQHFTNQMEAIAAPQAGFKIASDAIAQATSHPVLTGVGASSDPSFVGFKGDPTQVANTLARLLSGPDLAAAQAQLGRQLAAPGGVTMQQDDARADVYAKYGQMLETVRAQAGSNPALLQHAMQSLNAQLSEMVKQHDARVKQATDSILGEIKFDGTPGPVSVFQLSPPAQQAYASLPPEQQRGIAGALAESSEIQAGKKGAGDPTLFNNLLQRVYLPSEDPNAIRSMQDIMPYLGTGPGHITSSQLDSLHSHLSYAQSPEGSTFGKEISRVKSDAKGMLMGAMTPNALQYPELAEEAAYRFGSDLDARLKAYRAQGKPISDLFQPGNPDYVLAPSRVMSFMPSDSAIAAYKARITATGAGNAPGTLPPNVVPRLPGETAANYLKRTGLH